MPSRCALTKISASQLRRKFTESALLVGWVVAVAAPDLDDAGGHEDDDE